MTDTALMTDTVRTANDGLASEHKRFGLVLTRSTASFLFLSADVSDIAVRFLAILYEDRPVEVLPVIHLPRQVMPLLPAHRRRSRRHVAGASLTKSQAPMPLRVARAPGPFKISNAGRPHRGVRHGIS
jgi:hypothetical protein